LYFNCGVRREYESKGYWKMSKQNAAEKIKMCRVLLRFLKWSFQFEACILNELVVGACATALAPGAAISMPPVPVVTMLAVWTFMHPNAISFIAPAVASNSSLESVFWAGQSYCLLFWITVFWVDGVRRIIFFTQLLGAFFHAWIPRFVFIVHLAFVDAIVSCGAFIIWKAHFFLAQSGATLESSGQFIVATLARTAFGVATTRNLLFCSKCPQNLT